jgi:hypothetical protein
MQVIRKIVILFGLAVVTVGLYLFVIGVGAPIEIKSIELGPLKGSATGTFVGLLVAGVGIAVAFVAMQYMKKTTIQKKTVVTEETSEDGRRTTTTTETVLEEAAEAADDNG